MNAKPTQMAHPTAGASAVERWRSGMGHETTWWEKWIRSRGAEFPGDFHARLDPTRLFPELFRGLTGPGDGPVEVLDVGAGPLTSIGPSWPGRELVITAVDPLADAYNRVLDAVGIQGPVRTCPGEGERLVELFGENRFDMAHSRNAIDHSHDPIGVIAQMLKVLKPGGAIFLQHAIDEGEKNAYAGLHQWNFSVRDGRFVVWNSNGTRDVLDELGVPGPAQVDVSQKHTFRWVFFKPGK